MNKIEHENLKRELETMCHVLQPGGKISFNWSGQPVGQDNKDLVKYTCAINWRMDVGFFERKAKAHLIPNASFVRLVESHAYAKVNHFWERYQREPRFDIQVIVLQNLVKLCSDTMARRFGPNWREKVLLKSQGQDIALDEKRAFATLHTMGGPRGGGEWIHVPASAELPEPHMRYPSVADNSLVVWRAPTNSCAYEIDELDTGDERTATMDDMEHFNMLKRRVTNKARLLPDANGTYGRSTSSDDMERSSIVFRGHRNGPPRHSRSPHGRTAPEDSRPRILPINDEGDSDRPRHKRKRSARSEENRRSRKDHGRAIAGSMSKDADIERERPRGHLPEITQ
ncbi:hypothetical protein BFW01_g2292 [Lasiodiplodia theobromae]|uniref:Uncharacterized protein n=1 Tax=Lasiodiplodia theobromae TaxID=45133 RepID=A0A5N5DGX0_9PEZI|nr:Transcription elongation factor b polypeptide 3 isoform x2 [Lasiodiplodia theobromae]KAB2577035.1 hypothetical protein DBV05_g4302 [Lasiodiplodia theobromae]KAF4543691.1 Transcription elongation factor b polypeptide 3 isoform x2 [Lasiodiplodia theobromae]KAF9631430.1 hypothetical protein BFW01_g2292 [Lasiodiplodia theobromae]